MIENLFSLEGKRILVTGSSSGIGKQIALTVSKSGGEVVLTGRNQDRLSSLARGIAEIASYEPRVVAGDLTDPDTIPRIVDSCDYFDGVVHAAGVMNLLPFKFLTQDLLREMMEVNFFSPTLLSMELVKRKKLTRHSSIVYITSINGSVLGSKANSMYAASKGALTGMIRAMAIDLAKSKVRVNEIAPGMIETEGAIEIKNIVSEEAISEDIRKYPLRRYGTPLDVACACVYLLSEGSSWVTGSKIVIDGGYSVQ